MREHVFDPTRAVVYLDGVRLGSHFGGYDDFAFEITSQARGRRAAQRREGGGA